jgi:glycine cleavage system H protein
MRSTKRPPDRPLEKSEMASIPKELYYTEEHEYLRPTEEEGVYLVGITDYAQGELGDVVFVELPDTGVKLDKMEVFGTIEAVKAVSDLYCPVKGQVVEVNADLDDDPSLVNSDPYGAGWMIRLKVADPSELSTLLGSEGYAEHIG